LTYWIKYAAAACSEPAARLNLQIHSQLKPEVDPYRAQNPNEKDLMGASEAQIWALSVREVLPT